MLLLPIIHLLENSMSVVHCCKIVGIGLSFYLTFGFQVAWSEDQMRNQKTWILTHFNYPCKTWKKSMSPTGFAVFICRRWCCFFCLFIKIAKVPVSTLKLLRSSIN